MSDNYGVQIERLAAQFEESKRVNEELRASLAEKEKAVERLTLNLQVEGVRSKSQADDDNKKILAMESEISAMRQNARIVQNVSEITDPASAKMVQAVLIAVDRAEKAEKEAAISSEFQAFSTQLQIDYQKLEKEVQGLRENLNHWQESSKQHSASATEWHEKFKSAEREAQALHEERDQAVADGREANQTATQAIINLAARDQEIKTLREKLSMKTNVDHLHCTTLICVAEELSRINDSGGKGSGLWKPRAIRAEALVVDLQKSQADIINSLNNANAKLAAKDRLLAEQADRLKLMEDGTPDARGKWRVIQAEAKIAKQAAALERAREALRKLCMGDCEEPCKCFACVALAALPAPHTAPEAKPCRCNAVKTPCDSCEDASYPPDDAAPAPEPL